MPTPSRDGRRLSADESRALLVDAATRLFRERPPKAVSVREIAAAAGVNHGLVHRHFGGKDGLLRAVLSRIFRSTARAITARMDQDLEAALADGIGLLVRERWTAPVLAHLLQVEGPESIPTASMMPVIRQKIGEDLSPDEAALISVVEAAVLGWMLFEPLVARGTGLDALGEEERLRAFSRAIASQLAPAMRRRG